MYALFCIPCMSNKILKIHSSFSNRTLLIAFKFLMCAYLKEPFG